MEALMGVNAALLCVYDLVKAVDPVLVMSDVLLCSKEGGKSGTWTNPILKESAPALPQSEARDTSMSFEGLSVAIVTISDRCSRGEAEDRSGPEIERFVRQRGASVVQRVVVPDTLEVIRECVGKLAREREHSVILLTGGTGMGPRDVTPEALSSLWTRRIPGVGELLRSSGSRFNDRAWLSRSEGGFVDETLVIAFPGSLRAVSEGLDALSGLIPHILHVAAGGGHH